MQSPSRNFLAAGEMAVTLTDCMREPKKAVRIFRPLPAREMRNPATSAVVHVVHHHVAPKGHVDAPLRAGWIFALLTALLLGTGVALIAAGGSGGSGALTMAGLVFGGIGYYLALFAELVIVVLAIVAMVRGAAVRGILLLVGAPVMGFVVILAAFLVGGAMAKRTAGGPTAAALTQVEYPAPAAVKPVDPLKSAARVDAIMAEARKMLDVRNEALYRAAKTNAFAQAANDPGLTPQHRETLRTALRAVYAAAEAGRPLPQLR